MLVKTYKEAALYVKENFPSEVVDKVISSLQNSENVSVGIVARKISEILSGESKTESNLPSVNPYNYDEAQQGVKKFIKENPEATMYAKTEEEHVNSFMGHIEKIDLNKLIQEATPQKELIPSVPEDVNTNEDTKVL